MCKRVSVFLALAFAFFGTQCWASIGPQTCTPSESPSCMNTFSPGVTEGVYDFTGTGDGKLTVHFVTVLTTFSLTVTFNHTIDPLDPNVFPAGTVCTLYLNARHNCDQYDFTGSAGGPHGVPVKNVNYKGLITLTLDYSTDQAARNPAFGHAPGEITTFTEDILTGYFQPALIPDPVKIGKVPGLSSVVSLDEPLNGAHCPQFISPTDLQTFTVGQEIEVEFRIFGNGACTGKPIRDKVAHLSVAMTDRFGNFVSFPRLRDEEGNKFQFDPKDGVNEHDVSTEGLASGSYTITVFSDKFSPHSISFFLAP
jgi:hypothetical protein